MNMRLTGFVLFHGKENKMATIGGLLLICAALLMFYGKIYEASIFYITADIAWVYLAFISGNIIGAGFVLVGGLLNLGVFIKMSQNKFVKNLKVK